LTGFATRDGQDGRQYTPVVATEYQNQPSAVLSRMTMRSHLTSSATDEDVGFGVIISFSRMLPKGPLFNHRRRRGAMPPDFRFARATENGREKAK
jgi:hypothetical protein